MSLPPLSGLRVLDFTRILAGPYLTEMLGALGADIVKIEPPEGDPTRHQGAPNVAGTSYYFYGTNAGKRSIALDLRNEAGRELALAFVEKADVLIENFRPGVLEQLGLGPEVLAARNPRLIQLSISAFGADAAPEERVRPSFDLCTQARGGTLSLNGRPGALPARLAIPMGDLAGSFYGAIAVLAALYRRDRFAPDPDLQTSEDPDSDLKTTNKTPAPRGEFIDLALLDAQIALLGNWIPLSVLNQSAPDRIGSAHKSAAPYDVYEAQDKPFVVAVFMERFWKPFLDAVALPDLGDDPRFVTSELRVANRGALDAILRPHFLQKPRAEWLRSFLEQDVPAEPVASVLEAIDDKAFLRRGMLKMDLYRCEPEKGRGISDFEVPRVAFPAKFTETTHFPPPAPTVLGGDTTDILREWLAFSLSDEHRYRSRGAFGAVL